MVEVAERSRPARLGVDHPEEQPTEQNRHLPCPTLRHGASGRFSPQAIHVVHNFGDNISQPHHKFVDKPVVAASYRRIQFVLPEGAGENRRNRAGERSSERPGSWSAVAARPQPAAPGGERRLRAIAAAERRPGWFPTSSFGRFRVSGTFRGAGRNPVSPDSTPRGVSSKRSDPESLAGRHPRSGFGATHCLDAVDRRYHYGD
jgi:hypothetical protein